MARVKTILLWTIYVASCIIYAETLDALRADHNHLHKIEDAQEPTLDNTQETIASTVDEYAADTTVPDISITTGIKRDLLNPDPCSPNPCKNDGVCTVNKSNYTCDCKKPYSGRQCEMHPCHSNPCENDGACIAVEGHYGCVCEEPFTGRHCEIHPCSSNPCENAGICRVVGIDYRCTCMPPFSGKRCELIYPSSTPSENTEISRRTTDADEIFTTGDQDCNCGINSKSCHFDRRGNVICQCKENYAQRNETCSETCKMNSDCFNGGSCQRVGGSYFCKCREYYNGDKCENNVCEPVREKCRDMGAVCRHVGDIGVCKCPPGTAYAWLSEKCEDICDDRKCMFGECVVTGETYECVCYNGYFGKRCENGIGEEHVNTTPIAVLVLLSSGIVIFLILSIVFICLFKKLEKKIREQAHGHTKA